MARVPGAPKGGFTFGNVPAPPEANFGGTFTDIGQGISSLASRLREISGEEDTKRFRDAQAALEQERFESSESLTREIEQGRTTQRQTEEGARERRGDRDIAEANRRALEAQQFEETQAELDRALQRTQLTAGQGVSQQQQRDTIMASHALNLLANNRSPEEATAQLVEVFGVTPQAAQGQVFLATEKLAGLRREQAEQQARLTAGLPGAELTGEEGAGGPDTLGFPQIGVGDPPPEASQMETLVQAFLASPNPPKGDEILTALEGMGASQEEIVEAQGILTAEGIEFTLTKQDEKEPSFLQQVFTGGKAVELPGLPSAFQTRKTTDVPEDLLQRLKALQ